MQRYGAQTLGEKTFRAASLQRKQKEPQTKPHQRQPGSCSTAETPCITVHKCKLKVICTRSCSRGADSVRRAGQLRQLETHNTDRQSASRSKTFECGADLSPQPPPASSTAEKTPRTSALSLIVGECPSGAGRWRLSCSGRLGEGGLSKYLRTFSLATSCSH